MSQIDLKKFQELYWDFWICSSESKLIFQWNNNELFWIKKNSVGWYDHISHVIKMIVIISPNWFSNIFSYIIKVIIKHIFHVLRILMDNIILNYLLYNVFYLTIFCVNDVIDDAPSLLYIFFCSIEFMLIKKIFWLSNLASDKFLGNEYKNLQTFYFDGRVQNNVAFFKYLILFHGQSSAF